MYIRIAAAKTVTIIKALLVFVLCAAVLVFSKESCEGALSGLNSCLTVLIPSLFPFMAISSFIVKSGLSKQIGKPFAVLLRKLFGLSAPFAPVILLSLIGGYPVGARGIYALYKNGEASEKETKKAAMFAVCSGPGFLVNFVGVNLYNNKTIGLLLLLSQVISVLLLGLIVNIFDKECIKTTCRADKTVRQLSISTAIVESAADSAKGMLGICTFVVLFSSLGAIICAKSDEGLFEACVICLLEVCSAVNLISKNYPIEFLAFATGFGGLCVHFQIYSALGDIKISKPSFFLIRIIQGFMTSVFVHFGLKLFNEQVQVFSSAEISSATTYGGTIISAIALICVSICFLYSLKNDYRKI